MRMSLRGTGLRPDDLTGELFGIDEDDRFCRQFSRRAGPRCKEIVTQNFCRFGVKRHVERSPEQIDATACERWRVIWISPEFRPAVIRCPPPPVREWPVAASGVERPDVEVLDAIRSVQIVEGSPLAQRPAHEPAGVAPRTPRVAREQSCFDIRSELGQSQEIIPVDARERSPVMGRHLSRIPSRDPAASRRGRQALHEWMGRRLLQFGRQGCRGRCHWRTDQAKRRVFLLPAASLGLRNHLRRRGHGLEPARSSKGDDTAGPSTAVRDPVSSYALAMKRHLAKGGGWLAGAGGLTLLGYLATTAAASGSHPAWPYWVFAGVIVAGLGLYFLCQEHAGFNAMSGAGSSEPGQAHENAEPGEAPESERRREFGQALREARLSAGLTQEFLARQLPKQGSGTEINRLWLDRVEQQADQSDSNSLEVLLPQRNQLIAWARACGKNRDSLLDCAKDLLPEYYPGKFIPQPRKVLPATPEARDWRVVSAADPREVVGRVTSLLREGESRDNRVELTLTGPLLQALSAWAGSGSVLDPLMRDLTRYLESESLVLQLWAVGRQDSHEVDWLKLMPGLLKLSGFPGSYKVLLATPQRGERTLDLVTVRDSGSLIILKLSDGYLTIPVPGDVGAAALASHFDFLTEGHLSELLQVFNWGPSPEALLDWQSAMADADECPGRRMLIQPFLGDVTVPWSVQDRLLNRWRDASPDRSRNQVVDHYGEVLRRRRDGFERALRDHKCYDVVSGAAFDQFVENGTLQVTWTQETPRDRSEHLEHLLELLECENYNLAIVNRSDEMYYEIFGDDTGTSSDKQLYCLLKERGGDAPSVFTSTYFGVDQSRGFEIRHPRIFQAYEVQVEAILANLAPSIWDKTKLVAEIKRAMNRIGSISS
jgi:hypothetical protein